MAVVPRLAKNLLKPYEWEIFFFSQCIETFISTKYYPNIMYHHIQHHKQVNKQRLLSFDKSLCLFRRKISFSERASAALRFLSA